MEVQSAKSTLEKELQFSLIELDNIKKDVSIFSKLAYRALFNPEEKTRKRAQRMINKIYFGAIKNLDVQDGERIIFTIKNPDGEYSCTLGQIPDYLMDQPYHPVLFSD